MLRRRVPFLVCFVVSILVSTSLATPRWYTLLDQWEYNETQSVPAWTVTDGFTRHYPEVPNGHPTVVAADDAYVPEGLHCTSFAIDLALIRRIGRVGANYRVPSNITFYLWNATGVPPLGTPFGISQGTGGAAFVTTMARPSDSDWTTRTNGYLNTSLHYEAGVRRFTLDLSALNNGTGWHGTGTFTLGVTVALDRAYNGADGTSNEIRWATASKTHVPLARRYGNDYRIVDRGGAFFRTRPAFSNWTTASVAEPTVTQFLTGTPRYSDTRQLAWTLHAHCTVAANAPLATASMHGEEVLPDTSSWYGHYNTPPSPVPTPVSPAPSPPVSSVAKDDEHAFHVLMPLWLIILLGAVGVLSLLGLCGVTIVCIRWRIWKRDLVQRRIEGQARPYTSVRDAPGDDSATRPGESVVVEMDDLSASGQSQRSPVATHRGFVDRISDGYASLGSFLSRAGGVWDPQRSAIMSDVASDDSVLNQVRGRPRSSYRDATDDEGDEDYENMSVEDVHRAFSEISLDDGASSAGSTLSRDEAKRRKKAARQRHKAEKAAIDREYKETKRSQKRSKQHRRHQSSSSLASSHTGMVASDDEGTVPVTRAEIAQRHKRRNSLSGAFSSPLRAVARKLSQSGQETMSDEK